MMDDKAAVALKFGSSNKAHTLLAAEMMMDDAAVALDFTQFSPVDKARLTYIPQRWTIYCKNKWDAVVRTSRSGQICKDHLDIYMSIKSSLHFRPKLHHSPRLLYI